MTTKWIGPAEDLSVGDVGFLIEFSPDGKASNWVLRGNPAHTNQSHEPRLHGWCGSWNNVSTNAHGVWKVVKTAKNGRAQVVEMEGAELEAELEALGYPELS